MSIPRFYISDALPLVETFYTLPSTITHRAIRVLRLKKNDLFVLFNGRGQAVTARLEEIGSKIVSATIISSINTPPPPLAITLIISIISKDKMNLILQKGVELGLTHIIPVFSEWTQRSRDFDPQKKQEQYGNTLIAAAEQSDNNWLPKLSYAQELIPTLEAIKKEMPVILLHPGGKKSLTDTVLDITSNNLGVVIGPEAGWSPQEIHIFRELEIDTIRLGPRILRVETAVLTIVSIAQFIWGDLKI